MRVHACPFCDEFVGELGALVVHGINAHNVQGVRNMYAKDLWAGGTTTLYIGNCPVCCEYITEYRKRWNWHRLFMRRCMQSDPQGHRIALTLMGLIE